MRADFLVGPDGRLLLVHYGKDIGRHLSLTDVERALAKLSSDLIQIEDVTRQAWAR